MEKTIIKPLGENVLVEIQMAKQKTEKGIYLPDTGIQEAPQEGKVIAMGDSEKIKVKKNQRVIFREYGGTELKIGEKKYVILKAEDILAVIE